MQKLNPPLSPPVGTEAVSPKNPLDPPLSPPEGKAKGKGWRHGALVPVVFCAILANATPSNTAAELILDAQSAEEIELLEEVALWVEPEAGTDGMSLREALRERPEGFEVLRQYPSAEARSMVLAKVPYAAAIRRVAERHGVDELLVAAIVSAESSFNAEAVSHRGAVGLMQVMPAYAGSRSARLTEPEVNLDVGARYLRHLLERYGGDLELVLAAYNAGPANVRRYDGVPPFRETRRYVEKVLRIYVSYYREAWRESGAAQPLDEL